MGTGAVRPRGTPGGRAEGTGRLEWQHPKVVIVRPLEEPHHQPESEPEAKT